MPATNELLQEGRYRINQPVSADGNVFEAYDTVRNTKVLVREFPVRLNKVTTVSQQESIRLAFATQAKALSEIEHESLLQVEDYFAEIDRQYLVMESIQGEDMYELLRRNKRPFAVDLVLSWADELLDALNYLHSHRPSIIHRNVRPQNLRRHPSGKLKLLGVGIDSGAESDFSMSSQFDNAELRYSPMEQIWPGLDAASQKVITNSYDDRSERILKEPLDPRSDIYSLGATLYFLITGLEPVDPLERSIDILEGKVDPLREPTKVDPQIPAEISDVLMKALEIKRENRFDSAFIMRQVLKMAIARVEEREGEDVREQEEAAEIIKRATQARGAEPQKPEIHQEQVAAKERCHEELPQQQLRDAEQQRILAEKQAAEAERVLREQEEAAAVPAVVPEDNLLELPAAEDVVGYIDSPVVDETELAAVLDELERAELATAEAKLVENKVAFVVEPGPPDRAPEFLANELTEVNIEAKAAPERAQVFEESADLPTHHKAVYGSSTSEGLFAETERPRYSLPIPAIAGAVGLVVVIAVGVWLALSVSTEPAIQLQPAAVQVEQPSQPEPDPAGEVITSTQTQPQPEPAPLTESDPTLQQGSAQRAAPTAKPRKVEAPKPAAEKKKAVTVDDLINDN